MTFTATPASGYVVNQWLVNGTVVQTGGTNFTLNNVLAAASLEATFTDSGPGTNVVFSDNFSGNSIDPTKWTTSGNTVTCRVHPPHSTGNVTRVHAGFAAK